MGEVADGGFKLTRSKISIHSSASGDPRSKMNVRPSFDDRIFARTRTDSASSVVVRAFVHILLKSTSIVFERQAGHLGGKEERVEVGVYVGALGLCHEETRSSQSHNELKACASARIAVQCPPIMMSIFSCM